MNGEGKGKPWYNQGVKEWLTKLNLPSEEEEVLQIKKVNLEEKPKREDWRDCGRGDERTPGEDDKAKIYWKI